MNEECLTYILFHSVRGAYECTELPEITKGPDGSIDLTFTHSGGVESTRHGVDIADLTGSMLATYLGNIRTAMSELESATRSECAYPANSDLTARQRAIDAIGVYNRFDASFMALGGALLSYGEASSINLVDVIPQGVMKLLHDVGKIRSGVK